MVEKTVVKCGVLQDSIADSILFIIYCICNLQFNGFTVTYTDDTCLFFYNIS